MENKKIIIPVVVITLIIALFSWNMSRIQRSPAGPVDLARISAEIAAGRQKAALPSPKEKDRVPKYAEWARDPFSRLPAGEVVKLTGILADKEKFRAIINNRVACEGDKIDSYTIVGIKKDGVIVNDGKQDIEIKLSR